MVMFSRKYLDRRLVACERAPLALLQYGPRLWLVELVYTEKCGRWYGKIRFLDEWRFWALLHPSVWFEGNSIHSVYEQAKRLQDGDLALLLQDVLDPVP